MKLEVPDSKQVFILQSAKLSVSHLQDASMLSVKRLQELLDRFPDLHVAVMGDFFLDRYLVSDPALDELSVETGLVANQVVSTRCSPGAAGTVTSNLSALGVGHVEAIGIIGDDGEGFELLRGLHNRGVRTDHLFQVADRFTPTYMKPMRLKPDGSEVEQQRIDIKNRTRLPRDAEQKLLDCVLTRLHMSLGDLPLDGLIFMDQVSEANCGSLTDHIRDTLCDMALRYPQVVVLADSRERIGQYHNINIKPNMVEALGALNHAHRGDVTPAQAQGFGRILASHNNGRVYMTLGEQGIAVCDREHAELVDAVRVEGEVDIVGAGDSASAGIVAALCAGAKPSEAAELGTLCAAITVTKIGTTGTASPAELVELCSHLNKK
ncbi:MAG: PfkB family carbohydrate kinase [Chthonomonadales bacterium]